MNNITLSAHAKINLFLSVGDKLPNGYHAVETVLHTVSLCDTVTLSPTDGEVNLHITGGALSAGEDNLCMRAARLFLEKTGVGGGVAMELTKRIPMGAGLGGGSSDAGAVLRGLNDLYRCRLSMEELCKMAVTLGADVPFCTVGGCAIGSGIGEVMTPCHALPDCLLVLAMGKTKVSTAKAYEQLDHMEKVASPQLPALVRALENERLSDIANRMYNRFEDAIFAQHPAVAALTNRLSALGAVGSMMSGSGAAVFGLFAERQFADRAVMALQKEGNWAVCVQGQAAYEMGK